MERSPFIDVDISVAGLDDFVILASRELLNSDIEKLNREIKEQFFEKFVEELEENCFYEKYSFDLLNPPAPEEVAAVVEGLKQTEKAFKENEFGMTPEQLMRDAMEGIMEAKGWESDPLVSLSLLLGQNFTKTIRCDMLDALEEAEIPIVDSVWGAEFEQELVDRGLEAVEASDQSNVLDILNHVRVARMAYNPAFADENNIGELAFNNGLSHKGSVVPDDNFGQLLSIAGIRPSAYRDHLKAIDAYNENAQPEWDDFIDTWEGAIKQGHGPAIDHDDLDEILDNLYQGGTPVIVADIPVKEMLDGMGSVTMIIHGGQIGVHEFCNGSGHLVDLKGDASISPSMACWEYVGEKTKLGFCPVNETYLMTNKAYEASISVNPVVRDVEETAELGM